LKLYDNDITSLKVAKAEVVESGDLREYKVGREPAKILFETLNEYRSSSESISGS
jgi:hypothetical protein